MIVINVLPQEYLTNLQKEKFRKKVKICILILMIISLILSIISIYFKKQLSKEFRDTLIEVPLLRKESQELFHKIFEVNTKLKILSNITKSRKKVYPFILEVIENTPEGINFTEMRFDPKKLELDFKGLYKKRETFVEFENKLKNLPNIKVFYSPIQNKILEENGIFEIKINFKKE